jgi:hypothetical protein
VRITLKGGLRIGALLTLLLVAGLWIDRQRHIPPPPPTPAEIEALQAQRDTLGDKLKNEVLEAGEKSLARAPRAGIMIGVPTRFVGSVAEQVVTGLLGETTLTLRNLRASKEGEVKTKLLLRKKKVGEYDLQVKIHEAKGLLRPGKPVLSFETNRIGITLPVALAEGEGSAELKFKWDSKGLAANTVCGDVDITREVTGKVVPGDYSFSGAFEIAADREAITLRPDFGEPRVRIFVDPSEQAWQVVDGVIAEQRAGCRVALEKADIKAILAKILGKGFNVKIPKKIFKPVRLPAGVRASLDVQGVRLDLAVLPSALLVAEDRVWYGADLHAKRGSPGATPGVP